LAFPVLLKKSLEHKLIKANSIFQKELILPDFPESILTFSGLPLYLILPPELAFAFSFFIAWRLMLAPEEAVASPVEAVSDTAFILEPDDASYFAELTLPLRLIFEPDELFKMTFEH